MPYTYATLDGYALESLKGKGEIELVCEQCGKIFSRRKCDAVLVLKKRPWNRTYCSKTCQNEGMRSYKSLQCAQCGKSFERRAHNTHRNKSGRNFCCRLCSVIYGNQNKTTGTRRSKLEIWLADKLPKHYPNLAFLFNGREAIGSELDILVPSLNLAFELNGIFHYEPVYGSDKLNQIQNNDRRKFAACHERGISLCILDVSSIRRVTDKRAQVYLDIIISLIDERLKSHSTVS
jgi:hypothetical protein